MNEPVNVATAVAYNPEMNRFLVLKRAESIEIFPDHWDFPSGKTGDETSRKAVLRELKEETGLSGQILKSGDSFEIETEYGDFRIHPFLVKVDSEDVSLSREHVDCRWIDPSELEEMKTVKALEEDLESVGVTLEDD